MAKTLLAPQTAAGQSSIVRVKRDSSSKSGSPISLSAPGLAGGENADVQFSKDEGATWDDLFQDGAQIRITSINNMITIFGPGTYRVDKEATAAAVGIFEHNQGNP